MSTLAELETEVAEEIGLDETVDQTKLRRFLNRGVRDFLRRTRCFVQSETFTPGANINYTLDSTVLDVVDMYFTDSTSGLERVSVAEIHRIRRAGSAMSPTDTYPRFYAFQNPLVMFDFAPGASDTLTVVNVPSPTAMSSALHDPSDATYGGIPEDYHDALALYAESKLGSFTDDQSSAQGQRYWDAYLARARDAKKEIVFKGGHRLGKAIVSGRRSRYVSSDPSADRY